MQYKITKIDRKVTSSGKSMASVSLESLQGAKIENVAIWDSFPRFPDLTIGTEVEGDIVEKQNGQYVNRSLYAPKQPTGRTGGNSGVKVAMERKEASIAKFQDKKEESIALSGAQRDAVLIVTELKRVIGLPDEDIQSEIIKWRNWFLSDEFKNYPPF